MSGLAGLGGLACGLALLNLLLDELGEVATGDDVAIGPQHSHAMNDESPV